MRVEPLGSTRLGGQVLIQGSKNIAQKVVPACVRRPARYLLKNMPEIEDTNVQLACAEFLGAIVERDGSDVVIDSRQLQNRALPAALTMGGTGTFMFAGALLGRFGRCEVAAPGGDRIGYRPVDYHVAMFRALGADATMQDGILEASYPSTSSRERVRVLAPGRTVNGTVNVLLAMRDASAAAIERAAIESDVLSTLRFLAHAGFGTFTTSGGVIEAELLATAPESVTWTIPADRNDTATFALIGAHSASDGVELINACTEEMGELWRVLESLGCHVNVAADRVVVAPRGRKEPLELAFEGGLGDAFSTDWGPILVGVLHSLHGRFIYRDTAFTNRFAYTPGLAALGSDIEIEVQNGLGIWGWSDASGFEPDKNVRSCRFTSDGRLGHATVRANDVRAGMGLLIAALSGDSESIIDDAVQIGRGYEHLPQRLRRLGASVGWVDMSEYPLPHYQLD